MPKENKIKKIIYKDISWYKLEKPTETQLLKLKEKFNFHPLDIEDCMEKIQRPKLDIYHDYIFMGLHLPYWSEKENRLKTTEINVFLGKTFLITVSDYKILLLDELFYKAKQDPKKRARFFGRSTSRLFHFIFNQLILNINPLMREVGKKIDTIDRKVLQGKYKDVFEKISEMRRSLIVFDTIIKPQIPIFRKLESGRAGNLDTKNAQYWGNLVDRLQFIQEQIEDYLQILEGLAITNESLLSYKTNEIIKILTIFSVILLPLTLISGIYGMNIETLPLASSPSSFIVVSGLMLSIAVIMLLFFKYKKWL
ncbi:hypothetical protein COT75_05455 [Candidatus Beckwithbacteria bacterium CG10_big_fil_rev_8_21_14_0_10_34_10]|uniref:Magnesium transporter CorA n=1 Tax=Candidatus Beckwithbacteria bacterium CG10_big_fil_rev_8_21_14_0_10_34_10 TaxID=1974495 RepID=A0A2H0W7M8_9BACT|nr:MAG: hypothetical protein COT75_05455 [Candidatus Beckwithbacteria bacterium CG10_big_fil_rev_8_21_14_0_10_34_10]